MKRAITMLTILAIIIVSGISLSQVHTPAQLFIGVTVYDSIGRLAVLAGLVSILVIHRPRTATQRTALGVIGLVVFVVAMTEIFGDRLALFDGMIYFIGATSLLIEALEPRPQPTNRKAIATS